MLADHCDVFWPVATLSGCILLLSFMLMSLLVMVLRCVGTVVNIVSDVRPLASTLNKAITSGAQTSGCDGALRPTGGDELWWALGADARAVVALCLGWLASRC